MPGTTARHRRVLEIFGERLKIARERSGYRSASQFANAIGIEPHTYRTYERGESDPKHDTIIKICQSLKIRPNYLLPVAAGDKESLRLMFGSLSDLPPIPPFIIEYEANITAELLPILNRVTVHWLRCGDKSDHFTVQKVCSLPKGGIKVEFRPSTNYEEALQVVQNLTNSERRALAAELLSNLDDDPAALTDED